MTARWVEKISGRTLLRASHPAAVGSVLCVAYTPRCRPFNMHASFAGHGAFRLIWHGEELGL